MIMEAILFSFEGEGQQRPRSRSLRDRCGFGYSSFQNSRVIPDGEQLLYQALRDGGTEWPGSGVSGENFKGKHENFRNKKFTERKINSISLIHVFELWFAQC